MLMLMFMFKKVFIIFLLSSYFSKASIWIKAPHANFYEFKAHVISLGKDNISYADHLEKEQRSLNKDLDLKDKIIKAQKHYLSGELSSALKAFKKIIKMSFDADWTEGEKRAIFYSFLRLAQNEDNKNKRKALLMSGSQFMVDTVTKDNYPDYNLFPPPFLKELKDTQDSQVFLSVDWKTIFPNHETILLNGKKIDVNKDVRIPEGSYRVTALSSSHSPWIKVISLSYLSTQKIQTKALTSGYCESLKVKIPKTKLFNTACKKQNQISYLKTNKQDAIKDEAIFENNILSKMKTKTQYINKDLILKNDKLPWFIAGTALVVGGVLFYKRSKTTSAVNNDPF